MISPNTLQALANYHEMQATQLADAAEVCDPVIAANTREKAKVHRGWANVLRAAAHDAAKTEHAIRKPLRLHLVKGGLES